MKEKISFIDFLFADLLKNVKIHMDYKEKHEKDLKQYREGRISRYPDDANFLNKNHGKVAIKRKIIYLRQELLNLERMVDE